MKISAIFILPAALLLFSCSEPKKSNVVDIRPGAPLFPTASQPATAGAQAGINPAHGQPGHNCAVPVGAPLPGAAAASQPAAPSLSSSTPGASLPAAGPLASPGATPAAGPVTVASQPVSTPVALSGKPAAGLNPAHGQPGHDCAVPVGAPLNSKGAAAKTSVSPAIAPAVTPVSAPTAVAPGTNPPHGQPGHDCAIAVGAPLKKK